MPYILAKAIAPDTDFWRMLHRLADAATPQLAQDVEAILTAAGRNLSLVTLQDLLARGEQDAVLRELLAAWETHGSAPLQTRVTPLLEQLAMTVAVQTPALPDVPPLAIGTQQAALVREIVGARIVDISETTREAIQGILQRAWDSGRTIQEQAQEIRAVLGLTNQQAASVSRYRAGLLAAQESPARVTILVEERSAVLRRQRALNVARTETITAANLGQQTAWREQADQGFLDTQEFRRVWLTAQDEATCSLCAPVPRMNPEGVGLEEPFQTPAGPIFAPTLHVNCRCTVIGRFID